MTETNLRNSGMRRFLLAIDQDLASKVRVKGCGHCGGTLHSAQYPRKVCDARSEEYDENSMRISFCCNTCRKRSTPASVRYFGRRRYSAVAMILLSAMQAGVKGSAVTELRTSLGVARRTLERWRQWWRNEFVRTPFWEVERGRFMPPLQPDALPMALLQRFSDDDASARLIQLLRFLSPLTGLCLGAFGAAR